MTNPAANTNAPGDLALHLVARRETLLNRWRLSCEQDDTILIGRSLSREEFNDMIPSLLNILNQRMYNEVAEADPVQLAAEHGLHRWQNGYSLASLVKEVSYLQQSLVEELQTFLVLHPATEQQLLSKGYREVIRLIQEVNEGSVARYDELEKNQAMNRAQALEEALQQVNDLAQQRSDLLRTSSHDLKSSFGVIQSAAFLLDLDGQNPEQRTQLRDMINRNLTNVQQLLVQLMDMARLEAGQEPLDIKRFDVAQLIREIITSATPMATERQLTLLADGPDNLLVESDPVKVHRIMQNLLLNALRYTSAGMVSITWSRENDFRWLLSIQDTGPGLPVKLASGLFGQLKPTPESPATLDSFYGQLDAQRSVEPPTEKETPGEGIGLRIVKQLCELLGANMDVETRVGTGTLFRIRFPMHYPTSS